VALTLVALGRNKFILGAFLLMVAGQALILFAWWLGVTAESAFDHWSQDELLAAGIPVLDPALESVLMRLFWIGAAVVLALTIESLITGLVSRESGLATNRAGMLVFLLLIEGFVLTSIVFSRANFHRTSTRPIVSSVSTNGSGEIRLVPMQVFADVNGVVIVRRPGARVWRTAEGIGDWLTESRGERFVWTDNDSKAYLLFRLSNREVPIMGFDFVTNQRIDPASYREQP
jgi:hypothetical protein